MPFITVFSTKMHDGTPYAEVEADENASVGDTVSTLVLGIRTILQNVDSKRARKKIAKMIYKEVMK